MRPLRNRYFPEALFLSPHFNIMCLKCHKRVSGDTQKKIIENIITTYYNILWPNYMLIMFSLKKPWYFVLFKALVIGSAKLSSVCILRTRTTPAAICSLQKWYASATCFLFNVLPGLVVFRITPILFA